MVELTEKEQRARKRVCLALDNIDHAYEAVELAKKLSPYVGMFKVGKELHAIGGFEDSDIVFGIWEPQEGMDPNVFLDLKLHDTPNTVYRTSKAIGSHQGVRMFNIHVPGGEAMCKRALEGVRDGAEAEGRSTLAQVIGVTILTSLSDEDLEAEGLGIGYDDLVRRRTELARKWGLDGVVCPANKAGALEKEFGSDFTYVTPGIKWKGKAGLGQKQLYTPDKAVRDCSNSVLVVGSAITGAEDRAGTAYDILQAMAKEL